MPQNWANGLCAPAATPAHYADGATPGGHIAPPVESTATPGLEGPKTTTPDRVYGGQYQRIYDIPRKSQTHILVTPGKEIKFSSADLALSDGWHRLVSPEGKPYFHCPKYMLYTNAYLPGELVTLDELEQKAMALIGLVPQQRKDRSELVLDLLPDGTWKYYFADTVERAIFWVHSISLADIIDPNPRTVVSNSHLALQLESLYWLHIEMFPQPREVTQPLLDEVNDLLTLGYHDLLTSVTSTAPYSSDKLQQILDGLSRLRAGENQGIGVWTIARYMHTLKREMFIHYYGQRGSRLNRNQSVHVKSIHKTPTCLFLLCSPLLFFMPDVYIRKLEDMYVDETINVTPWNRFWDDMRRDWERSTTPVTVLLSTNVGFLAIQSIDAASNAPHRSVAQIASYASTVLSLACYLICWTLSRQHPPGSNGTAEDAITYLAKREKSLLGLEADALIFSLPTALFTWSMLAFLVSMTYICFAGTDTITRTIMSILLFGMTGVVVGVLHADWGAIAPSADSVWKRTWQQLRQVLSSRKRRDALILPKHTNNMETVS